MLLLPKHPLRYRPMTRILLFALLMLTISPLVFGQDREGKEGTDYAKFQVSRLTCVIGNNHAKGVHRAWYNGVFSMVSPDQEETPYVPIVAGVNLEHFFDAQPPHSDERIFFEPRSQPMTFTRLSATTAELRQKATPHYGVESYILFELKEPYYVDYTYTCIPRKADLAGGFLGVFWASYINAPLDKSYYFIGANGSLDKPFWEQFLTQNHDRDSTLRHVSDNAELNFLDGPPSLWRRVSQQRYTVPFYYGRFRNMVLIYAFQSDQIIRFAHSPSGGGPAEGRDQSNPAWDFQMIVPNYKINQPYTLKMRVIYKPWVDRADVLQEAGRYLKTESRDERN